MDIRLTSVEVRVLGSLIEKELATPEYYPLSLNALTNACNQKSNRDPVVDYDEATVESALDALIEKGLVSKTGVGRVPKYEEIFTREPNFINAESAVLCVLLLRGPQTPGAIRTRTARMFAFESLDDVLKTLANLEEWGFVERLPRLPGHKESRYGHLMSDESESVETPEDAPGSTPESTADTQSHRIDQLEQTLASLSSDVADLKAAFEAFKRQFE